MQTCDTHIAARTWPTEPPGHGLLLTVLWLCVCPPPQRDADLQQAVVSALAPSPLSCQPHVPRAKRSLRSGITSGDGGTLRSEAASVSDAGGSWRCTQLNHSEGLRCYSESSLDFKFIYEAVKVSSSWGWVDLRKLLCWVHGDITHPLGHVAQV